VGACTAVRIETAKELSTSAFICLSYSFFLVSEGTAVLLIRIRKESFQFFLHNVLSLSKGHCSNNNNKTTTTTTTTTTFISWNVQDSFSNKLW
jgi:hypothetical protein